MLKCALFVFRRDLRLDDNTALIEACSKFEEVFPLFIFDPRQTNPHPYLSVPALNFMVESLRDLRDSIGKIGGALHFFQGEPHHVLDMLLEETRASAVYANRDYTPFSLNRDKAIEDVCKARGVNFNSVSDALINAPEEAKKGDGDPYTVFTPFYKNARKLPVRRPVQFSHRNLSALKLRKEQESLLDKFSSKAASSPIFKGGSSNALIKVREIKNHREYDEERNFPAKDGTTGLSPHNKFGTVSIRTVYHEVLSNFGEDHKLISEIYWRDFFTHVAHHFPHVFKGAFHRKYDALEWSEPGEPFLRFKEGVTGFPIVDAGVRQLLSTGWMHNRVRMIVASFLTKDLHISWREGERFFANHLVDYDPCVNNGSWQWAASTGCDAQPYFRIFNPWLQQKRFDPGCEYIKRWIPELSSLSPSEIHGLENSPCKVKSYPPPIVDHSEAASEAKALFSVIS